MLIVCTIIKDLVCQKTQISLVTMADLFNTYLNIGDTNKFFMPWFIPRQNRHSVFQSTFLSRLFGRKRRDIADEDIEFEINGRQYSYIVYLLILFYSMHSSYSSSIIHPLFYISRLWRHCQQDKYLRRIWSRMFW